jgi:hypothetical protein
VGGLLVETQDGYDAILPRQLKNSANRSRFALAHEIAHLLLHRRTGLHDAFGHRSVDVGPDAAEIERLCDVLAVELLMPSHEWSSVFNRRGVSFEVLSELAEAYQVSNEAASRRLAEISPWRCAVIFWSSEGTVFRPKRVWARMHLPAGELEAVSNEDSGAGSPQSAVTQKGTVIGSIQLTFDGNETSFVGQSRPLYQSAFAVQTLIIGEPHPLRVLTMHKVGSKYWVGNGELFK